MRVSDFAYKLRQSDVRLRGLEGCSRPGGVRPDVRDALRDARHPAVRRGSFGAADHL